MGNMHIPIEIYDLLETRLGHEDGRAVAKSIEESLTFIEDRSREAALQRKLEVREELQADMSQTLASKADLAKLEEVHHVLLVKMDKKFTVLWITTIFVVIFVNQSALTFMAQLLGLLK